jgi:microcompartment protein CcmK/EutM
MRSADMRRARRSRRVAAAGAGERMRIAEVIGTVTLSRRLKDVPPGRFIIVQPQRVEALRGEPAAAVEPVVAYDELSAGEGARVGLSEGREAAMPFHPRPVPVDVYCAAVLDAVDAGEEKSEV